MAIFGLGAHYSRDRDVSDEFIKQSLACIGWTESEAPALYRMFRSIKVGDIIYLKSHPPQKGLIVRAVGLVINNRVDTDLRSDLGGCILTKWIWSGSVEVGKIDDKFNVRNNTLYEEFNPEVQTTVLDLLIEAVTGGGGGRPSR